MYLSAPKQFIRPTGNGGIKFSHQAHRGQKLSSITSDQRIKELRKILGVTPGMSTELRRKLELIV